jgi:HEAT repeat protein
MARARLVEEALAAVHAMFQDPERHDLKRDLAPFFRHKSNHVAAAAAGVAERLEAGVLVQDLVDAYGEWMKDPAKRDPGCEALIAIAKALAALEHPAATVYFSGIRHVQMEGSFGPPVDAAAPLRGICAQGLALMAHPDALTECVTLLADKWIPARVGAIRAIANAGLPAGELLLRLKALVGDEEDEVTAECFAALLRLEPSSSLEFVAKFLGSSSEALAGSAALALGESRLAGAFPFLRKAWEGMAHAPLRRTLMLAMAMLRLDEAVAFLMERLELDSERVAADAIRALALYSRDETIRARVEQSVSVLNNAALRSVFQREFGRV